MRLACSNCGAEYEVDDDVIPGSGRDVQCSDCGHTWFEQPARTDPDPQLVPAQETDPSPEPDPVPGSVQPPEPAQDADTPPARRKLDPEVADILREEREREEAARRAEADRLESQADLGLEARDRPADPRGAEARRRMERLRGQDSAAPQDPAATTATASATGTARPEPDQSRRDLLPDIDEINATLRSDDAADTPLPETTEVPRRAGGGRAGFLLVVLLAVLAALVYTFAAQIGAAVPELADPMAAYVAQVNDWRLWLDLKLQDLMAAIEGTGGAPAPDTPPDAAPETPDSPPE
jgi:predicted Zn finger-like uncharacterized protein